MAVTTVLRPSAATYQKIDHLALALGIKRGGGFVQQQHLRVKNQNRGQGDPFFFSRREMMRRTVLQMRDLHLFQNLSPLDADLFLRPLQL